jgi:hypothetical protein
MTTQMDPTEFRERLDATLREPGELSPGASVEADVALGRRLLRRRRGVAVLGAAAAVAVVVGGLGVASGDGGHAAPSVSDVPAPGSLDEESVLEACRTGAPGQDRATAAIFGRGAPVVKAVSRTEWSILLTLEAADGAHWAWCDLHPTAGYPQNQAASDPSLDTMLVAYDPTERSTVWPLIAATPGVRSGPDVYRGCRGSEVCHEFQVSLADRVPATVAAVQLRTGDDKVTTVPTVDGYYAFEYIGDLPHPIAPDDGASDLLHFRPLQRITYVDAAGEPIAAGEVPLNAADTDFRLKPVPGLPPLTDFPSLRGDGF